MCNNAPKTVSQAKKYHYHKIINSDQIPEMVSKEWFEAFGDDRHVTTKKLFTEMNSLGEEIVVFESYTDSGSEDYLYLISK